MKRGSNGEDTCWEIANPMTTSSSRTSQVTTAELAFRCLTVTLTGAEGLSARARKHKLYQEKGIATGGDGAGAREGEGICLAETDTISCCRV